MQTKTITAALLGLMAVLAMGCARNDKSAGSIKQDPVISRLYGAAVSPGLTAGSELEQCDEPSAAATLDRQIAPVLTSAASMWRSCEELYACSPTIAKFLKEQFQSGATFSLGYVDLRKLKVPKLGDKVGGMYLPHSEKIFLDTSIGTPRDACALLLHELVHRFDPVASSGEESLRTEFRAYWYQTTYGDEQVMDQGAVGQSVRQHIQSQYNMTPGGQNSGSESQTPYIPFHTRESLLRGVAQLYGFQEDSTIINHYPKLPREPQTQPQPEAQPTM